MRFTVSAAALLAFAANVLAQNPQFNPVTKPTSNEKINAGTTYTVEWSVPEAFKDVTVSISLIGGATQNTQIPLLDIASGVPNSAGKYTWTIPNNLGKDAFYGLVLKSETNPTVDFQFSNPFHIVAGEGASSGTTTVTSSVGTATVTLSSASASATAAASKTVTSEVVVVNSTTALTSTAAPTAVSVSSAPATVVTSVTKPASNATVSRTASTTLATVTGAAGGAQATAGVFAVLGGLAVAALL